MADRETQGRGELIIIMEATDRLISACGCSIWNAGFFRLEEFAFAVICNQTAL